MRYRPPAVVVTGLAERGLAGEHPGGDLDGYLAERVARVDDTGERATQAVDHHARAVVTAAGRGDLARPPRRRGTVLAGLEPGRPVAVGAEPQQVVGGEQARERVAAVGLGGARAHRDELAAPAAPVGVDEDPPHRRAVARRGDEAGDLAADAGRDQAGAAEGADRLDGRRRPDVAGGRDVGREVAGRCRLGDVVAREHLGEPEQEHRSPHADDRHEDARGEQATADQRPLAQLERRGGPDLARLLDVVGAGGVEAARADLDLHRAVDHGAGEHPRPADDGDRGADGARLDPQHGRRQPRRDSPLGRRRGEADLERHVAAVADLEHEAARPPGPDHARRRAQGDRRARGDVELDVDVRDRAGAPRDHLGRERVPAGLLGLGQRDHQLEAALGVGEQREPLGDAAHVRGVQADEPGAQAVDDGAGVDDVDGDRDGGSGLGGDQSVGGGDPHDLPPQCPGVSPSRAWRDTCVVGSRTAPDLRIIGAVGRFGTGKVDILRNPRGIGPAAV